MPELERVQLLREIRLHGRLDHPNVVTLYAAFMEQVCCELQYLGAEWLW
jgi:serine/threonine protein kinase